MKKTILKMAILLVLLSGVIVESHARHSSIDGFDYYLGDDNQNNNGSIPNTQLVLQQSTTFKNLHGQDRKAAFLPLQALLVTKSKSTCIPSTAPKLTLTTRSEVYNLLGTPDETLSPYLVSYHLGTSAQNCKVIIGFDSNNNVLSSSIENCQ